MCKVLEDHNARIDLEPEVRVMPKRANKTPPLQGQNFIVGSMDVKALFPNCKKQKSSENIEKAFKLTNLDFKNVDTEFLVKLVSVVNRGKHQDQNLQQFLQTPKARTTLNSFLKKPKAGRDSGRYQN